MTMDPKTLTLLADLNREFYAAFAGEFARTRRGWPPGFDRILPYLPPGTNVLDLGCGNGRFLAFLAARHWHGSYLGLDNDRHLLSLAQEATPHSSAIEAAFLQADLLDPAWGSGLAGRLPARIVCLAVLHHIPGLDTRQHFLANCSALLPPDGLLILSTWQFLSAKRLLARIVPWTAVGLSSGDVEPGDYLVAWGEGAAGHRYCASIDEPELISLATEVGLVRVDTFRADGKEGNLNLYGVFVKRDT
jgi:2-polyprenyl-3-methyl-5-hydroxy-6-metoxy-1,4-benzoquinol methylase